MKSKVVKRENLIYELDMFYFLPKPNQLIQTHFPDKREWQMLEHPLSLADFETIAFLNSYFFTLNLELRSHKECIINCGKELEVRIGYTKASSEHISFSFDICFENGTQSYKGCNLSRWGMFHFDVKLVKKLD